MSDLDNPLAKWVPEFPVTNIIKHGLTLFKAWISNYILYKLWDEITYLLPNFNDKTVELWESLRNFKPTLYWVYDYLSILGLKLIHVGKMSQ